MTQKAVLTDFLSASDRALLDRTFVTTDPESLAEPIHLSERATRPNIVRRYDVTPPRTDSRDYVWCGHCRKLTHWKGYVIETPDGRLTTLGHDCGREQFGFAFGEVENEFYAQADRQRLIPPFLIIRSGLSQARRDVDALLADPATIAFDAIRDQLRSSWRELWNRLKDVDRNGGRLIAQRRIYEEAETLRREQTLIRYQAKVLKTAKPEERAALRFRQNAELEELEPVYRIDTRDFGVIGGREFVAFSGTLGSLLQNIRSELQHLERQIDIASTDAIATSAMSSVIKGVREQMTRTANACSPYDAFGRFWEPKNLVAVAAWATADDRDGFVYRTEDLQLIPQVGAPIGPQGIFRTPSAVQRLTSFAASIVG